MKKYTVRGDSKLNIGEHTIKEVLNLLEISNTKDGIYYVPNVRIMVKEDKMMIIPNSMSSGGDYTPFDDYEVIPKVNKLDRILNTKLYKLYITTMQNNQYLSGIKLKAAGRKSIEINYLD